MAKRGFDELFTEAKGHAEYHLSAFELELAVLLKRRVGAVPDSVRGLQEVAEGCGVGMSCVRDILAGNARARLLPEIVKVAFALGHTLSVSLVEK